MFCTRQYCFVLHEYFQQEATHSGLPTFPPFSLEQKRWEHVQEEALVKETALNEEVAGPERFLLQSMTCEGVESINGRYNTYNLERLILRRQPPLHDNS